MGREEGGDLCRREVEAPLPVLAVEVGDEVVARLVGPLDHHELAVGVVADAAVHPPAEHLEEGGRGAREEVVEELGALGVAREGEAPLVERLEQRAAARAADGGDDLVEDGERARRRLEVIPELLEGDAGRGVLLLELGEPDEVLVEAGAERGAHGVHDEPRLERRRPRVHEARQRQVPLPQRQEAVREVAQRRVRRRRRCPTGAGVVAGGT